jgi:hypothetical protein
MRPISSPNPYCLLLLLAFAASAPTMTAMAEPPDSSSDSIEVRTTKIQSHPDAGHNNALASPANSPNVHVLQVRPRLPDEQRDASGRPFAATQDSGNVESEADFRVVHTIPIRPETGASADPDHRVVRTIRVPSQAVPQEELR